MHGRFQAPLIITRHHHLIMDIQFAILLALMSGKGVMLARASDAKLELPHPLW